MDTDLFRLEEPSVGGLSYITATVPFSSVVSKLVPEIQFKVLPVVRPDWAPEAVGYRVLKVEVRVTLVGFYQASNLEDVVLVKISGNGNGILVDGKSEEIVMSSLYKAGLSPPLYLAAENALCYGYVPGKTLTADDLQTDGVLKATACAIAQFHAVPVPDPLQGSKPQVWAKIDQWMELVAGEFSDVAMTKGFMQTMGSVEHLKQEIDWLKAELGADRCSISNGLPQDGDGLRDKTGSEHLPCDSHTVLCHNDPQPLNFILSPDGTVTLIDFEFSGINYPAFDVGDFFCEFAGLGGSLDYGQYPSESVQKLWIRYYLEECARIRGDNPIAVTCEQVHTLYRDANKFALAAHFMWTLWSLILCQLSPTNSNYLEYGCLRYEEYQRRKKLIINNYSNN